MCYKKIKIKRIKMNISSVYKRADNERVDEDLRCDEPASNGLIHLSLSVLMALDVLFVN